MLRRLGPERTQVQSLGPRPDMPLSPLHGGLACATAWSPLRGIPDRRPGRRLLTSGMSRTGALNATNLWLGRIGSDEPLSAKDRHAVERALSSRQQYRAGGTMVPEGANEPFALLILDGIAARTKVSSTGERQILSILLPGDFCAAGLSLVLPVDYNLVALSECCAARISAAQIVSLQAANPGLILRLLRTVAEEAAVTREWAAGLGTRSGLARTGRLMCELTWRLRAVGIATGPSVTIPVRQADIADAAGLSGVQVNRLLKGFERSGLIRIARGSITVLDERGLAELCGFDPDYLARRRTPVSALAWSGVHVDRPGSLSHFKERPPDIR